MNATVAGVTNAPPAGAANNKATENTANASAHHAAFIDVVDGTRRGFGGLTMLATLPATEGR